MANTQHDTADRRLAATAGSAARVLRLTLKKRWFDMIASGEKLEEYRKLGKWILSRLDGKTYDAVEFSNGYGAHVPKVTVEYRGWHRGPGRPEWGATWQGAPYAVIRLGRVLSRQNAQAQTPPMKTPKQKPASGAVVSGGSYAKPLPRKTISAAAVHLSIRARAFEMNARQATRDCNHGDAAMWTDMAADLRELISQLDAALV